MKTIVTRVKRELRWIFRSRQKTALAREFTRALLMNPRVDQILTQSPLHLGAVGDCRNMGEFIARETHRLAGQYLEAMKQRNAGE